MKLPVALCVLVAICFATTDAIPCYECVYFEGHPNSDAQCQKSPSSDRTCNSATDLKSQSLKAQLRINDTLVSTYTRESRQELMVLCAKFTGSMDGKSIVARGCITGVREFIGICTRDAYIEIEGRNATNVEGCFCSGNRCNSAAGIQATHITFAAVMVTILTMFVAA